MLGWLLAEELCFATIAAQQLSSVAYQPSSSRRSPASMPESSPDRRSEPPDMLGAPIIADSTGPGLGPSADYRRLPPTAVQRALAEAPITSDYLRLSPTDCAER